MLCEQWRDRLEAMIPALMTLLVLSKMSVNARPTSMSVKTLLRQRFISAKRRMRFCEDILTPETLLSGRMEYLLPLQLMEQGEPGRSTLQLRTWFELLARPRAKGQDDAATMQINALSKRLL